MLKPGDLIAFSGCSNGLSASARPEIETLKTVLEGFGLSVLESPSLYAPENAPAASPQKRAGDLTELFLDPQVKAIFDLTGGDLSNQLLDHLDLPLLSRCSKPFFGYSDLTPLLNVLSQKAGIPAFYFQLRTLLWEETGTQKDWFRRCFLEEEPFSQALQVFPARKSLPQTPVLGGNLRCLLKLAGTPYFPDLTGKVLFLEARSGSEPFLRSCLSQLTQMGVFNRCAGLLIGQFTELSKEQGSEAAAKLILETSAEYDLPAALLPSVGHSRDGKCLPLGRPLD